MGKKVKSRNARLSLVRVPTVGKTKKRVATKMKSVGKPAAAAFDVEEMLESSVIFTNDGSSRTRSGLRNGESVQRTPTHSRGSTGRRRDLEVSDLENGNVDTKSPPILTRSLRGRSKEISPVKPVRRSKPTSPLVESNVINDQMTLLLEKLEEPIQELSVPSDEPVEEESMVDPKSGEEEPKLDPAPIEEELKVVPESAKEDSKVDPEPEPVSLGDPTSSSNLEPSQSPKSPTAAIEDGSKSPQRAKYLLKQLESTLSPKFVKPNKTDVGLPKSRYGRIQKQKENSDYIPLDVARFITKSPAKNKLVKLKENESLPESIPPTPEEADQSSTEDESIQPTTEEMEQSSLELQPSHVETSISSEASLPRELSDPSSSVEILHEEIIPANESDTFSEVIPIMDPNASLVGIDKIQIIDLDASFGESTGSAAISAPVAEEVDPPKSPEKSPEPDIVELPAPEAASVTATTESSLEFTPGQMLWGAFNSKTAHWPCMISPDPEDNLIKKLVLNKTMVHVKFFADNGRRAWIRECYVLPYSTVDEYKSLVDTQFKSLRHKVAAAMRRELWLEAIRQADDTQNKPIEAREQRYQELLDEERSKPKPTTMRRRTKSVSVGYHSNSFDESYESGRKRHRSRTPESPAYEPLPLSSKSTESLSKRIKLESTEQDLFRSTISRYFQSMTEGSDVAETASGTSSECDDITEMLESDKEIYNNFLNISRLLVFEGQTETEVDRKLQKYVQKICALRMHSIASGARLSNRLRSQALRKLGRELGVHRSKQEDSPSTSAAAEAKPKRKRVERSLEDEFIFDMEKNYLMKGVPRGSVCTVCTKPNDLVKCGKCCNFYHLACLSDTPIKPDPVGESKTFNCSDCILQKPPSCFVCNDGNDTVKEEPKFRCVMNGCAKQYHLSCLALFPQHKFTGTAKASTLFCPNHSCHTCVSDDPRSNATTTKGHLVRCIKCPSSYHTEAKCIPAGSQILSYAAMICPKHNLEECSLNVNWCFLCCKGGSLICCETCPTAFHLECLKFTPPEGKYICEECESGRMPLYNEVVWAKYGIFRFWPAITVPPPMVPDNIEQVQHEKWDICVRFFGTHDYVWLNRRRIYLYQEGDSDAVDYKRTGLAKRYTEALQEAKTVHGLLLAKKAAEQLTEVADGSFKPPMYVKIKSNRYVAPLKTPSQAKEEMEDSMCECSATDDDPCGPETNCINRALLVECNPKVCPAGERCQNQCFEKKQYPSLVARRIPQKGWGLVALEDIQLGQFVIEYVGEVINNEELARRLQHKVAQKDENYYFLTVDSELTIDAGPKGNLARFINHSCEPNCETMLWKVGGAQSVGLFAIKEIKAGEELTFNYNFESKGDEKKVCHCNASKCSGFIGQKYRPPLEEPSGSGTDKRGRKSDKKGNGSKRRKSTAVGANKRRKSTSAPAVESTPNDETPGGSKRKKRKVQEPVDDVTIKVEPSEPAVVELGASNSSASMLDVANTTTDNQKPEDEEAIKQEQQVTPDPVE